MRSLIFFLLLFCSLFARAQSAGLTLFTNFKDGYYYDLEGHKITGKIDKAGSGKVVLTFKYYILFKENDAAEIKRITPDMIKSFVVGTDSFIVSHDKDPKFHKVLIDGPTKLYEVLTFAKSDGGSMMRPVGGNMMLTAGVGLAMVGANLAKGSEVIYSYGTDPDHRTDLKRKNFIEGMSLTMSDEPELVEQIKDKTFRITEMDVLINVYQRIKSRRKELK
ncbi:hypothetical protein [Pedobacter cryoconitis]|uniref:Uncharacterized protein n=1 Tax=Pedobacter cryoconitis TaxID=188932 RepID=A0A7X0MHG1_9SPHI|nr:hypothetical protein [Pedobacter cryoconitis]MBB6499099.1 hypothetical protein [Pedobacter cryoconitis]